jgi:transcription termination factor NusB
MARTRKDPRHRAREAALQILYQWEIGGRAADQSADTFFTRQWPDADQPPGDLRLFATQLAVDTVERSTASFCGWRSARCCATPSRRRS